MRFNIKAEYLKVSVVVNTASKIRYTNQAVAWFWATKERDDEREDGTFVSLPPSIHSEVAISGINEQT